MTNPPGDDPYVQLFDAHPEPMWVYDAQTLRFLVVNAAALRQYGYSRDEFLAMTIEDIRPPEDVPALRHSVAIHAASVEDLGRWRHQHKDGSIVRVQITRRALQFDGRAANLVMAQDVTAAERQEAERAALLAREQASRAYFQRLFEQAPGPFLVLQPGDFTIVSITDEFVRTTGMTRERLLGKRLSELYPEDIPQPHESIHRELGISLERVARTGRAETLPVQPFARPLRDGGLEERLWIPRNTPILDSDGRLAYIIHSIEDVTEHHAAVERLRRAERLLGIASRSARIGGWVVDLTTQREEWSDEVCAMHELPPGSTPSFDEAIGYVAPEYREHIGAAFRACAERGEPYDEEIEIVGARGRRIWVRTIGTAVRDDAGNIVQVHGAIQDISDRKASEHSLRQSDARFRALADAMPQIVWSANAKGELDYANRTFGAYVSGDGNPALPVSRWTEAVHPDDLESVLAAWSRALGTGRPHATEFRVRRFDSGEYRWLLSTGSPVRDDSGAVVRWYGAATDIHDRRMAEQAARDLAARLNATLESIGDGFYTLDREWRFTFFNRQAERMLGFDRSEVLGRVLWDMLGDPAQSDTYREFHRAVTERRAVTFETYAPVRKQWFDVSAYPSDEGLTVYFRDVTQQHLASDRLRESESRFRALARATVDVIWDWNLVTDEIWWNDGFQTAFGYPVAEIEPGIESWTRRIHPDDRDRVVTGIHAAIEHRVTYWEDVYRFFHKDGSVIDVEDRGYIIVNEHDEPVRFVGGMSDVTERERLQAALAQQAALLDEASEAIMVRGPDRRIQYWNKGAERLYGWTADEALGRSVEQMLGTTPDVLEVAAVQLAATGEWNGQLVQRRKDGTRLTVLSHWTLLRGDRSEPGATLTINTDITERLALEDQLRQSQRLESIGHLTGGIAHDFNNLLTVILGSADLMLGRLPEGDRLRSLAEMTRAAAQRGAELTQRLLAFARRQTLEPRPVDVNGLLDSMDTLLRHTLANGIAIDLVQARELGQALVDPAQLEAAILNLCINARDAMPDGGRLIIETTSVRLDHGYADRDVELDAGEYVCVSFSDVGIGIPPEHLEQVFDPFFTTKPVGQGTGLGLSMVYGFAKQSGGHVDIASEVGRGTTVKLYLPRSDQQQVPDHPDGLHTDEGGHETILVAEDDELVRLHVEGQLSALGYRVIAVPSGQSALDVLRGAHHIDLLFTDVVMPGGMNGRELARAGRAARPGLRVLYTSGYTENVMGEQDRLEPGVLLLSKPYHRVELARKVRQALA